MYIAFILLALFITLIYFELQRSRRTRRYWKDRNIAFVKPKFIFGNILDLLLLRISFGELFQKLYNDPAIQHAAVGGIFILHQPALLIRDPDLIKMILIKNFDSFLNRYEAADYKYDCLGALTLPLSKYPIWRECRKQMSAVFTSGSIKQRMYPLIVNVSKQLEYYVQRLYERDKAVNFPNNVVEIEVKEMCSLFTTDLTGILLYGVDSRGLQHDSSPLRRQTIELLHANPWKAFNFFIIFFLPHLTRLFRVKVFGKNYMKFMRTFTMYCLEERENLSDLKLKLIQGDLIDILSRFKANCCSKDLEYTQHSDFIPSQVAIFLLAGFETSSATIAFILYELARYPDIQNRLKCEINKAFSEVTTTTGALSYDKLQEITYLHQVVLEGLRKYPAAAFINRECTPAENENGFQLTPEIFIPRGMPSYISILGLHTDPKIWQNPLRFDPERFSAERLKTIHPMTFIPFGAGPHGCIGSRLGLLQVKMALVHILRNWSVSCSTCTPKEIHFEPKSFMLHAKGELYLNFKRDIRE